MPLDQPPARLFIGSSAEGLDVARNLQEELEATGVCEVERWDVNVFDPGRYTLESLLEVAARVDFAVLIASPDDALQLGLYREHPEGFAAPRPHITTLSLGGHHAPRRHLGDSRANRECAVRPPVRFGLVPLHAICIYVTYVRLLAPKARQGSVSGTLPG